MNNFLLKSNRWLFWLALSVSACSGTSQENKETVLLEDVQSKTALQGIWVDDNSGNVQFRAEGDSLYYPEKESYPLYFKIMNENLVICGTDTVSYKIARLDKDSFWFQSITDELIKLHRSEYELDSLEFVGKELTPIALYDDVVEKDSVVMLNNHRYRGYVYINPSTIRVFKTSYNENGMKI